MSFEAQLPASSKRMYHETRVGMEGGKLTASCVYSCDYPDLWTFLTVANGTIENVNGNIQRIVPLRFPDRPQAMIASRVNVRGTGYNHTSNTYAKCVIDVDFQTPQFDLQGSSAFMMKRLGFGGNFITLPGSAYTFSGGPRVNQEVGRFVAEVVYEVTMYQLPTLSDSTIALIASLTGSVNNSQTLGAAPGYLRFDGGASEVQTTALFVQSYQLQLAVTFRSVPWNFLMHPAGSGYALVTDGLGNGIYPAADLTQLFGF